MTPLVAMLALVLGGCDGGPRADVGAIGGAGETADATTVPAPMAACAECHSAIVASFLGHGMASSLGPLDHRPRGGLVQPVTGDEFVFEDRGGAVLLRARRGDGGERRQLVVGRYGAGRFDLSYIGTELDLDGRPTGRLAFLPVEQVTGHGLALSPFELTTPGLGFDMPFTRECLECHTTQPIARLPGAATGTGTDRIWPDDALGADAFAHLRPLDCSACHGPVERHAALMSESLATGVRADELGLTRLGTLPAPRQRDVCARCHLQGEGRLPLAEVAPGGPQPADVLARRPTLVAAAPGDDFRFVGQVRRLALSRCLQASPDMTCASCHDPHASVTAQGTADFDGRCQACHGAADAPAGGCVRPAGLAVRDVTGEPARTTDGCVDCHVRRSQPFDLPHLRTADHFVRRRIPPPAAVTTRAWEDPDGALVVFDDGRLAAVLDTPAGARWQDGAAALVLARMGRADEAADRLARAGPAPPLPPFDGAADVLHLRGALLEQVGDAEGARAAYADALALDPAHPGARLNLAGLLLDAGQVEEALHHADLLVQRYPRAAKPWNLRARAAASVGDLPGSAAALARSVVLWPSDAAVLHELGRRCAALGLRAEARLALRQAAALQPSRPGLAEDLAALGDPQQ